MFGINLFSPLSSSSRVTKALELSSNLSPKNDGSKISSVLEFEEFEEDSEPSTWEKFSRKFKEQPLVPLGAGATTIALLGAGRAIQQGNSTQFNIWLRYRVIFQGLTVAAALVGSLYYTKQRDIDRANLEKERIRLRDLRIKEQEENPSKISSRSTPINSKNPNDDNQEGSDPKKIGSGLLESSESRREFMKKKIAEQAKLEIKPLHKSSENP